MHRLPSPAGSQAARVHRCSAGGPPRFRHAQLLEERDRARHQNANVFEFEADRRERRCCCELNGLSAAGAARRARRAAAAMLWYRDECVRAAGGEGGHPCRLPGAGGRLLPAWPTRPRCTGRSRRPGTRPSWSSRTTSPWPGRPTTASASSSATASAPGRARSGSVPPSEPRHPGCPSRWRPHVPRSRPVQVCRGDGQRCIGGCMIGPQLGVAPT